MNKRIGEQYTSLVKQISYKLSIATKHKYFKKVKLDFLPTYLGLPREVFVIIRCKWFKKKKELHQITVDKYTFFTAMQV